MYYYIPVSCYTAVVQFRYTVWTSALYLYYNLSHFTLNKLKQKGSFDTQTDEKAAFSLLQMLLYDQLSQTLMCGTVSLAVNTGSHQQFYLSSTLSGPLSLVKLRLAT